MTTLDNAKANAAAWLASIEEMNAKLADSEPDETRDQAHEEIQNSVLSVMVRDGWRMPGGPTEEGPDEYEILLSTGGPALRIYGRLNGWCEPETAELQMQDWGTPWTRYDAPEETLLLFAQQFYFGQ